MNPNLFCFKINTCNIIVYALLLFLMACHEPKKGCLDITATNFDAAADEDCCCEYPNLVIEIKQLFGTETYVPNRTYQLSSGHFFKLNSVLFYLSDFQMTKNDVDFSISDSISLKTFPDSATVVYKNDFQLIKRVPTAYTIGEFRESGIFTEGQCSIGIASDPNAKVIPSAAPTNHPLRPQAEKMWIDRDTGFVFLKIILSRDTFSTTQPDTLNFTRFDFVNRAIPFTGNYVHPEGYDFNLIATIDFKQWFEGVDLSIPDKSAWKMKIVQNLTNAFIVSQ